MKSLKWLICVCLPGLVLLACRKNGSGSDDPRKQRLYSISAGSERQVLEYDDQGRITRLYYNAYYSLKFAYSPVGVNIQVMGSGDVPDPDRKIDFTIVDGRINSGKEYLPNKITRNLSYAYDQQGRLIQIFIDVRYDGNSSETYNYTLRYNAQSNVQDISFVKKDNGGNDNSDSAFITKTYYDKKFILWGDMGFDYFGVAAASQRHFGYGITVPMNMASYIYPSNNALKSEKIDEYNWNPVTKKWGFDRTSTLNIEESKYQYDGSGRLMKYYDADIKWTN